MTTKESVKDGGTAAVNGMKWTTRRKVVYTLVFLLLLLLLVEGGLRVLYFVVRGSWHFGATMALSEGFYIPHPYCAFTMCPNAVLKGTPKGAALNVKINKWGFRGEDIPIEKPADTVRILTLGGSTTVCLYCSDNMHTWPEQMEKYLQARYPDRRIETVNMGCGGYTTAESLATFVFRGLDFDPDIVLILHGWNDLKPAGDPNARSDYTHFRNIREHETPDFISSTAISRTIRVIPRLIKSRETLSATGTLEDVPERGQELFRRNLETITSVARIRGIEPVLLTFSSLLPSKGDPEGPAKTRELLKGLPYLQPYFTMGGAYRGLCRFNDIIREIGERDGLLVVDLERQVPKLRDYYYDTTHENDAGLEVMGKLAAEALIAYPATAAILSGHPAN